MPRPECARRPTARTGSGRQELDSGEGRAKGRAHERPPSWLCPRRRREGEARKGSGSLAACTPSCGPGRGRAPPHGSDRVRRLTERQAPHEAEDVTGPAAGDVRPCRAAPRSRLHAALRGGSARAHHRTSRDPNDAPRGPRPPTNPESVSGFRSASWPPARVRHRSGPQRPLWIDKFPALPRPDPWPPTSSRSRPQRRALAADREDVGGSVQS